MSLSVSCPVAPVTSRRARFRIATNHPTEFIDLTDKLNLLVAESDIADGFLTVQSLHTTAAVVVNEHEPLLLDDFRRLLEAAVPTGGYAHDDAGRRTVNLDDHERVNGHSHGRALFLPPSASLAIVEGRLLLGRWQRVFLVELDGPRLRDVAVVCFGVTVASIERGGL